MTRSPSPYSIRYEEERPMFDGPVKLRVLPKAGTVLRGARQYSPGMVMEDVHPVTAERLVEDGICEVA
jgi:hypothetical protein